MFSRHNTSLLWERETMSNDGEQDLAAVLERAQEGGERPQLKEPPPDRITVAGNVYHQSVEGAPTQVSLNFERNLKTREQVFERRLQVGEDWVSLIPERCWLQGDQVGMIVVRNEEGKYTPVQLGPEEKDKLRCKVLWVGDTLAEGNNPYLIHPEECIPLTVLTPSALVVRSASGVIRYTVFVFPR